MKIVGNVTLVLAIGLSVLAGEVHACACCASAGLWHRTNVRPGGDEGQMLRKWAEKARVAQLMVGQADLSEFTKMSPTPKSSVFEITAVEYTPAGLWFDFRDTGSNATGGLRLSVGRQERPMQFMVDIRDGKTSEGGGVLLYKELVFEGRVRGAGLFSKGVRRGTPYTLILHGRGNGCHDPDAYKSWTLKFAGMTFFGEIGN